jgi:MFS family permease
MTEKQTPGLAAAVKNSLHELRTTFVAFLKAPRALWGVNIPYVFEGLVYFGILTILGKFCSENVALNDIHSGWVYGGVTGGITFAMLLFGGVSDKIGVRVSLALSLAVMMLGRILVALSGTLSLGQGMGSPMFFLMAGGLLLAVAAYGLYMPAAYAGVKRYTNPQTAAVAYGVVYGLMNLGAFLSGFVSANTRHAFALKFPPNGLAAVFWIYAAITLGGSLLTLLIISRKVDRQAVERVARETREMNTSAQNQAADAKAAAAEKKVEARVPMLAFYAWLTLALAALAMLILSRLGKINLSARWLLPLLVFAVLGAGWEFLRQRPEHPFRDSRFVFFIFILIPVQTLFAHNWLTIPYYLDRAFAGTSVSRFFEVFSNLNPILIFVLSPLIAALTVRRNIYKMMIAGTFVMALPTFMLAVGPNVYLFLLYILLTSVGEAMWQPRFLQWVAEIAPEGKTGLYMGIGQFPWFLTKMITSLYSGYMIAHFCPKPGLGLPLRTGSMWLLYALIAMVSPVALILARKWMAKGMTRQG